MGLKLLTVKENEKTGLLSTSKTSESEDVVD